MTWIQCFAPSQRLPAPPLAPPLPRHSTTTCPKSSAVLPDSTSSSRRTLLQSIASTTLATLVSFPPSAFSFSSSSNTGISEFVELPNSHGVKALDLRVGSGEIPVDGDQVAIHYYGRLAAKQGWRFDSTYDHKDENGDPNPFVFCLGSENVIQGIQTAVRSMRVGGIRRVVIPPSQGYLNTSQEPIPPNDKQFFDRQRLFTTIFNPTRLANGEGSTLGMLMFDIELVSLKRQ